MAHLPALQAHLRQGASLAAGHYVCPSCGGYLRMSLRTSASTTLLDAGSVRGMGLRRRPRPIRWTSRATSASLRLSARRPASRRRVRTGQGAIAGLRVRRGHHGVAVLHGIHGQRGGREAGAAGRARHRRAPARRRLHRIGRRAHAGGPGVAHADGEGVLRAVERHARGAAAATSLVLTDPTTGRRHRVVRHAGRHRPGRARRAHRLRRAARHHATPSSRSCPKASRPPSSRSSTASIDAIVERDGAARDPSAASWPCTLPPPARPPRRAHDAGRPRRRSVTYQRGVRQPGQRHGHVQHASPTAMLRPSATARRRARRAGAEPRSRPPPRRLGEQAWTRKALRRRRALERRHRPRRVRRRGRRTSLEVARATARCRRDAVERTGNRAWQSVQLARNVHRPTARSYLDALRGRLRRAARRPRRSATTARWSRGIGWIGGTPRHGHRAGEGRRT